MESTKNLNLKKKKKLNDLSRQIKHCIDCSHTSLFLGNKKSDIGVLVKNTS